MRSGTKSIMQDDPDYCYIHMKYLGVYVKATDAHHCVHGTGRRASAEEDGLKVYLCRRCHSLLHEKHYHDLDILQDAERIWMEHYRKNKKDWIDRYLINYLD